VLCAGLGDSVRANNNRGSVIVNIGGGKTEAAVLGGIKIINACCVGIGGKLMDLSVIDYVQENFNAVISEAAAENIRKEIGSLYETDNGNMEFNGADVSSNRPVRDVITAGDVTNAVKYFYDKIIEAIIVTINGCPPDIISDITETGITISGGAGEILGLSDYLSARLNLPVKIAEQSSNAVILGAGVLLNDQNLLKKVLEEN